MEPLKRFDIVDGPNAKELFDRCRRDDNGKSIGDSDTAFVIELPNGKHGFVSKFYIDDIGRTPRGNHSISGGTLPTRGSVKGATNEELLQWKRFIAIYDSETRKGVIEFDDELD